MMVRGLHGRFEGQQEKLVITDLQLWPVKTQPFKRVVLLQNEIRGRGEVFYNAC